MLKQLQVLRDARLHLMHLIPSVCAADQSCNGAVTWSWMLCVDPHDDGCTCRPLMRTSCGLPALPHNCRHSAKRPPHCSTSQPSFCSTSQPAAQLLAKGEAARKLLGCIPDGSVHSDFTWTKMANRNCFRRQHNSSPSPSSDGGWLPIPKPLLVPWQVSWEESTVKSFWVRPTVVTVVDSQGKMVPDRVRVSWGRLENFKCVDYFQIEYYEKDDRVCRISATSTQN